MDLFPISGTSKAPGSKSYLSPIDATSPYQTSLEDNKEGLPSLPDLYAEAYPLALQAVQEDANGDHHTARLLYCEVCEIFTKIINLLQPGEERELVNRKLNQYTKRAEAIWESRSASTVPLKNIKELSEYEKLAQEAQ
ncbi:hypothetical protein BX616_007396, partial [Lobosporangium transversale]